MKNITISDVQKSTSPNPISLICVDTPTGATNLTAISWWTYLSNRPPMVGFAISKKSYTGELLGKCKRAVLCLPSAEIAEEAFQCGRVSGRDVDKVAQFKIALTEGEHKFPTHSRLALMCQLENVVEASDHLFYICKVNDILFNEDAEQLFAWDGYSYLAPLKQ
jgi:flavin reductase (DIM6/NTAB) family NADH-FMN oxidoreductase RutF